MSTSSRRLWLGRGLALALTAATFASIAGGSVARKDKEPRAHGELRMMTRSEALETDAKEFAPDVGITVEEATEAILRQPRVGKLQLALYRHGPKSFGGLHLDYQPEYRINLLATSGHAQELRNAVDTLGYDDLSRFVVVTETSFTEDVLARAARRADEAIPAVRAHDIRVQQGRIIVWARPQQVDDVRAALSRADLGIPTTRVTVAAGVGQDEHGLAGMDLNHPNVSPGCTSGFSVRQTSDGAEGATTAGHCRNGDGNVRWTFGHHGDLPLTFVQGHDGGEQDFQWYRSPGLDDWKSFRTGLHEVRPVESKIGRTEMVLDGAVCHFGRSSGYGCGKILAKNYPPEPGDGNPHSASFISVKEDATAPADSGGPWFLLNTAYGFHTGSLPGAPNNGVPEMPYFMAQNFTEALGVRVMVQGQ